MCRWSPLCGIFSPNATRLHIYSTYIRFVFKKAYTVRIQHFVMDKQIFLDTFDPTEHLGVLTHVCTHMEGKNTGKFLTSTCL